MHATSPSSSSSSSSSFSLVRSDALPALRQMAGLPPGGRRSSSNSQARRGGGRGGRNNNQNNNGPACSAFKPQQFDVVVLDPPTFAASPFGAVDIVRDYQTLLKPAALATSEGGALLCTNHVSAVQLEEWIDDCVRCCAKAGRPVTAEVEVLAPHSDFPSLDDGRHPLKMIVLRL
mmetsp:Transcript_64459/g.126564  ORF Transcript_64459/g.126564 Transcript_64459/m.126564 type:complete len:175 (+) Transcript_64459:736-1260(+)